MEFSSDEEIDEMVAYLNPLIRRPRNFEERTLFEVEDDKLFREKFRVPKEVVYKLHTSLGLQLEHPTRRNKSLSSMQMIKVFLHFLGTNSFYHELKTQHGISSATVCRVVKAVSDAIVTLGPEYVKWPPNAIDVARQFMSVANFPAIMGQKSTSLHQKMMKMHLWIGIIIIQELLRLFT